MEDREEVKEVEEVANEGNKPRLCNEMFTERGGNAVEVVVVVLVGTSSLLAEVEWLELDWGHTHNVVEGEGNRGKLGKVVKEELFLFPSSCGPIGV